MAEAGAEEENLTVPALSSSSGAGNLAAVVFFGTARASRARGCSLPAGRLPRRADRHGATG